MNINPRHDQILTILQKLRQITVQELTDRLRVSPVTIRKDLTILEDQGLLIRSHGWAKLAQDNTNVTNLLKRNQVNTEAKQAIAEKALELIQDGDTIYLDSGSTLTNIAKFLTGRSLRVITNSLQVMNQLADAPDLGLIAVGGNYRFEAGSFIGPVAIESIRRFQFDLAFLGATAFSDRGQFFSQNLIESQVKEVVLEHARRRVIVADSSKYGASAFSVFARPGDVDILVTNKDFADSGKLKALGIEVILADHE